MDVLDHDCFRTRVDKEDDDPLGIRHCTDGLAEVDVKGVCASESWERWSVPSRNLVFYSLSSTLSSNLL